MKHRLQSTYDKYDNELELVTKKMNLLCSELDIYKKEYYKIMSYYRTQKQRKLITQEEYEEKANMFKFKNTKTNYK